MPDSNYSNLDNAKMLHELGFKGEFPQMVWLEDSLEYRDAVPYEPYDGRCPSCGQSFCSCVGTVHEREWYSAPTHFRALAFLQTKMPESCEIIVGIKTATVQVRRYDALTPIGYGDVKVVLSVPGLDEGIAAILDYLEAAHN